MEPRNVSAGRKNGIVLIIILWVIVVLTTVSLAYVRQVNLELKMVGFQRDTAIADSLAMAGLRQALIMLREDKIKDEGEEIQETFMSFNDDEAYRYDAGNEPWAFNPEYYEDVPFYETETRQGIYYVEVEDEGAKLPINAVGDGQAVGLDSLAHLIELTGVDDEDEARDLAGAILDWRDENFVPIDTGGGRDRGRGGDSSDETSYYNPRRRSREGGLPPVIMKNSEIGSIDEMLLIPGMNPAILYGTVDPDENQGRRRTRRRSGRGEFLGLMNFISVHSQSVNMNTVKKEVLESVLYGVLGEDAGRVAEEWVDYRDGSDRMTYTLDDRAMKTIDNSDLDDVHYTNVSGLTPQVMQPFGNILTIASDVFTITALGEYAGIQKGYRAVVKRSFVPFENLPVFGVDTFDIEDLVQAKIQILLFEPLYDAERRMQGAR